MLCTLLTSVLTVKNNIVIWVQSGFKCVGCFLARLCDWELRLPSLPTIMGECGNACW